MNGEEWEVYEGDSHHLWTVNRKPINDQSLVKMLLRGVNTTLDIHFFKLNIETATFYIRYWETLILFPEYLYIHGDVIQGYWTYWIVFYDLLFVAHIY